MVVDERHGVKSSRGCTSSVGRSRSSVCLWSLYMQELGSLSSRSWVGCND